MQLVAREELERLPPEAREQYQQEEQARRERLQAFGLSFSRERKSYIEARAQSGVEKRWREDMEFYHGRDSVAQETTDMMSRLAVHGEASAQVRPREMATRSRVFVNITRPKTNSAEARIADMLLPVDERNWGLKPTPVPDLVEAMKDTETPAVDEEGPIELPDEAGGVRPATVADAAAAQARMAAERASKMQDEIDDQLTEFDYNAECRAVIGTAARLGTGILKGPVVTNHMKRSWRPAQARDGSTIYVLEVVEERRPRSYCVSPWDFYPDMACGPDITHAEAVWERRRVTARELRMLAKAPGYMADEIREVLREGPLKISPDDSRPKTTADGTTRVEDETRFDLWERHGDVKREFLEDCGCPTPKDDLEHVSGCVVMVNNRVIKAYIHPLDTEDLIYDVYVWEPDEDCVFGFGVPYLLRQASQRIVNAAVRQMMDHGGVSAGPQVIIRRNIVQPADGVEEVSGRKLWYLMDDGYKIDEVFGVKEIGSHINDYIAIIELALKFADEEVALPMIMAGERGSAPEQVGSMTMLMNAATTVLRRLVKRFDDRITKRHIRRYYDWNMQYNPREEIKGDYEVDARGSTSLMQRDLSNQAMIKWLSALGNPALAYMFDKLRLVKKALQAEYIPPDDVLKPDDEIKRIEEAMKNQKPEPSPDARLAAEVELKEGEAEREHDLLMKALDSDLGLRDILAKRGMNTDKLKATLAQAAMKIRQDREAMMQKPTPKQVVVS